jgi:hypothetical protein
MITGFGKVFEALNYRHERVAIKRVQVLILFELILISYRKTARFKVENMKF